MVRDDAIGSVEAPNPKANFQSQAKKIDGRFAFVGPAFGYTTTLFAGLYVVQKFAGVPFPRAMENQRIKP